MKQLIKLFEDFSQEETPKQLPADHNMPEDGFNSEEFDDSASEDDGETNHTKYLNSLGHMGPDEIRQEFLEGRLNTGLRKKVAARVLGEMVASGEADDATVKLFHDLSDTTIEL